MSAYIPTAEAVFKLEVTCDAPVSIGRREGGNAMMIPITGGTVSGERLSGEVLPGGADWAVMRDDGIVVVDARYAIKADDGTIIQIFNGGPNTFDRENMDAAPVMITTPRFVAPEGKHDWLNHAVFVGTLQSDITDLSVVSIVIYKMV